MKNCHKLLLMLIFATIACNKNNHSQIDPDYVSGLPAATQIGANTFGCLVKGVPWVPQGYGGGSGNLSIDYDPWFKNGIFGISAQNIISQNNSSSIGIGIGDSLNFMKAPLELNLNSNSLYGVYYSDRNCFITYFDYSVIRKGTLLLTTYDKTKRVIAGQFNATLLKSDCNDTIRITKGRFDFKF